MSMEESMVSGYCMYCGRQIMNDRAVVGQVNVRMDRSVEVRNMLKLIKYSLYDGDHVTARALLSKVMQLDAEVADAWYIDAVLDKRHAKTDIARARGFRSLGIFSEDEVKLYRHNGENAPLLWIIPMIFFFFALMAVIPVSIIFEMYWLIFVVMLVGAIAMMVPIIIVTRGRKQIPVPEFHDEENEAIRAARKHSEEIAASRRR